MGHTRLVKRIALINPFQVTLEGYDLRSVKNKGQLVEAPLGLAYLSAYLKKHGYDVRIFDAHLMAVRGFTCGDYTELSQVEDELVSQITEFAPDVAGVSCLFHYIYRMAHKIVGLIKTINKDIITVMGGAYPTVSTNTVLQDENIDFVVLGEGERPLLNLLETLNDKKDFSKLKAIGYRDQSGAAVINSQSDRMECLDEVLLPDRSDFAIGDYYHYGRHFIQKFEEYEGQEMKIATLTATRGCVFDCSFCISKKMWGGRLRFRDPENVLDEIEYLNKAHGINYFAFNDDNLNINKKFACKLFQGIIDRKMEIGWTTGGVCVRGLDREIVDLMVGSGCLIFNIAIESGCAETLDKIHKPVTFDEVYRAVELIRDYDTYLMGLFMLGFPEETEHQFFETVNFGKSLQCDWTLYSCVTPFPGSEIYHEAREKGMLADDIEDDFERLNFRNYVLAPKYLSPEFVTRESYFANLDQNFFENPNLSNCRDEIALSDFKNVIKLAPDHASAYYCIARIYERRGELDMAGEFYAKADNCLTGLHKDYFEKMKIMIPS